MSTKKGKRAPAARKKINSLRAKLRYYKKSPEYKQVEEVFKDSSPQKKIVETKVRANSATTSISKTNQRGVFSFMNRPTIQEKGTKLISPPK